MATKKNEEIIETVQTPQVYITPEMSQSIDVLIQAVEMGQKAGVYSLQDAVLIGNAVNILNQFRPQQ